MQPTSATASGDCGVRQTTSGVSGSEVCVANSVELSSRRWRQTQDSIKSDSPVGSKISASTRGELTVPPARLPHSF